MRLQSTRRYTGDLEPHHFPGPGRLTADRLLARKAARSTDSPGRVASDKSLRSQLRIAKRALGGYVAPASQRLDSAGSAISQSRWAAQVEICCFGRFQVS